MSKSQDIVKLDPESNLRVVARFRLLPRAPCHSGPAGRSGRAFSTLCRMRRILVTGAATRTGGRIIRHLERASDTEVFAVDDLDPVEQFASSFERLSIEDLSLARHVLDLEPNTVVHLQTVDRSAFQGATRGHDQTGVGTQALLGAIGRCKTVRHVIVKSDGAIYGAGPRAPSVVTVNSKLDRSGGGYQRDLEQMETFVHQMADRHDHVAYTIIRLAPVFGPTIRNPVSSYLTLPGVPTLLGFDPRLQFISERDAVNVFLHAVERPAPGTFNVAGSGQLYLSRILRLGRRIPPHMYRKVGAVYASRDDARHVLDRGGLLGVFPEGESGFMKPVWQAYQVQRFGRGGFVRLSETAGAPVVPVAILGAEEVHPAVAVSKRLAQLVRLVFPQQRVEEIAIFLNPVPLPVRWHIRFLPPVLPEHPGTEPDPLRVLERSEDIRRSVQTALDAQLAARGSAFC